MKSGFLSPPSLSSLANRFIFLCVGYSTHKRFVLGGEECAAPFAYNDKRKDGNQECLSEEESHIHEIP